MENIFFPSLPVDGFMRHHPEISVSKLQVELAAGKRIIANLQKAGFMNFAYLIVGSGLTGAVIARMLKDAGHTALVVERRNCVGGNVHDHTHPSGIRIHTYGPHHFRTNDERIWQFVNRFAHFYTYEPALKSLVDGEYENWPIAGSYIRRVVGEPWQPGFKGVPGNFEEAALAIMPRPIYEKFVKGYTEKQWGVRASALSASLARRFDVHDDDEPRLMRHTYQGIPSDGYAAMLTNLLAGIPVLLNCDYHALRAQLSPVRGVIYTGPIDEYFGFDLGRLTYRGQRREHDYLPDVDFALPCGQVNNPGHDTGPHIRTLEWKRMMPEGLASRIRGTVITRETPYTPEDPDAYEYPFPDQRNAALYRAYRARADAIPDLLVCGRLGEYRYYDMDQAVARAQMLAGRIIEQGAAGAGLTGQLLNAAGK
ncbi:MAG: UDP-galactopyranose mutase [Gallionellaceae bacterium]|nr:UDP-galactopyranose mutase [Gallionellaceae bacterium]MDD5365343.1 UDP-galactopyranose mutase [Gallionellaceae bacterium]